ncbi:efflux RND transporter permease subunit, partial [Acinetobacter baumannii]
LTATLLKRHEAGAHQGWLGERLDRFGNGFNDRFDRMVDGYVVRVERIVDRKGLFLIIYGLIALALALLFVRLPTGFLPLEDQGYAQL